MSKTHITIVAGLPGSGKTTWAKEQVALLGNGAVLVDDPSVHDTEWLRVLPSHTHIFIADPHFCRSTPDKLWALVSGKLNIPVDQIEKSWVCFENDPEVCRTRARAGTDNIIEFLTKNYKIPADALILPISTLTKKRQP